MQTSTVYAPRRMAQSRFGGICIQFLFAMGGLAERILDAATQSISTLLSAAAWACVAKEWYMRYVCCVRLHGPTKGSRRVDQACLRGAVRLGQALHGAL